MTIVATIIAGWMALAGAALAAIFRKEIRNAWREPVMREPIIVIESDDWGAGPREQAERLRRLAGVLGSHADYTGRRPVMTLGVVLAVPDRTRMLADGLVRYHSKRLDHPDFAEILSEIGQGAEAGVFALQLHGGEHYWPPSILALARTDAEVSAWVRGSDTPATEALPARLQSRWIDAIELPSKPLRADEIGVAARAEVQAFRKIFGHGPVVAVPPTFIWNDAVESAWVETGVEVIVTPGRRYEERGADGSPVGRGPEIVNGDRCAAGATYLVRNDYFEPALGHRADRALAAVADKSRLGRPTLLETHRSNFLGEGVVTSDAIAELDRLLGLAIERFPTLLFLSPEEIARRLRTRDPSLVESRLGARLHVCLRRLATISRLRKLAWTTGVMLPAILVYVATFHAPRDRPSRSAFARA